MSACPECGKPMMFSDHLTKFNCHDADCKNYYALKKGPLHDSGDRTDLAGTGAVRDMRPDKGRFDLMPFFGEQQVAIHMEHGAIKYDARNWEKGLPLWNFLDSGLRHGKECAAGCIEERHDRAWAWNAICYLDTRERVVRGLLPFDLTKDLHPNVIKQIKEEKESYVR